MIPETVTTIEDDCVNEAPDGFIIYGVPGSAAETYATAKGKRLPELIVL